jgi:hypothetical protein
MMAFLVFTSHMPDKAVRGIILYEQRIIPLASSTAYNPILALIAIVCRNWATREFMDKCNP